MIFTFLSLPQGQPLDISKCFDSLSTSPEVAGMISNVYNQRNKFYATIAEATTKGLNEVVASFDYLNMMSYLELGPDFLDLAVKKGNYPMNFSYQPISFPSKILSGNNGRFNIKL